MFPEFDPKKSLELDKAQAAIDEAVEAFDVFREQMARAWKRKLEAEFFGEANETRRHSPRLR